MSGLAAALHASPKRVVLTDLNDDTIQNLKHNAGLLPEGFSSEVQALDWADRSTWPTEPFDVVIGSDLVYEDAIAPLLAETVCGLLKPEGSFFYVAPPTGRAGLPL